MASPQQGKEADNSIIFSQGRKRLCLSEGQTHSLAVVLSGVLLVLPLGEHRAQTPQSLPDSVGLVR